MRAANSAYDDKITFVHVDWDKHRNEPVSRELKVRYQSTPVMLKGDGEMGRLVAQTDSGKFKGLLDKAL